MSVRERPAHTVVSRSRRWALRLLAASTADSATVIAATSSGEGWPAMTSGWAASGMDARLADAGQVRPVPMPNWRLTRSQNASRSHSLASW